MSTIGAPAQATDMRVRADVLGSMLVANMALLTVAGPSFGILASTLIDTFDITRSQVGWLAAGYAFVAAGVSPFTGRLADRIGGRNSMMAGFAIAALVFLTLGSASGFAMLLVGGVLSGIPNGMGNQATNKYISAEVPVARRGLITGIKQSGVTFGVFIAGLTLPRGVAELGYRATMFIVAGLAAMGVVLAKLLLPADAVDPPTDGPARKRLPPSITWLATYGFLMGSAIGCQSAFMALYAEESLGLSRTTAGLLVGFSGLVAVFARVILGRMTQTVASYAPILMVMAAGGVGVFVLIRLSAEAGAWLLIVSTVLSGFTTGSWNAPVMLASMRLVPKESAGHSAGRIMLGFMSGYGIGPPVFGFAVDRLGSYDLPWLAAASLCAAASALMVLWRREERRPVHG